MTFYETYSASKEAHVFLFTFIRSATKSQRTNRLRNTVLNKALPSTMDARGRGHGLQKGWPTAPPLHGAFSDGCSRWTYPPTAPPKKVLSIINNVFTFCSTCYKIVRRYPNSPQKYKHFLWIGY